MTETEYRANNVIGYGIFPCMFLAILSTGLIANWLDCGSEMAFGLVIITIVLFGIWCTVWIYVVKIFFKLFHKNKNGKL